VNDTVHKLVGAALHEKEWEKRWGGESHTNIKHK
jgi:hypothetical protein